MAQRALMLVDLQAGALLGLERPLTCPYMGPKMELQVPTARPEGRVLGCLDQQKRARQACISSGEATRPESSCFRIQASGMLQSSRQDKASMAQARIHMQVWRTAALNRGIAPRSRFRASDAGPICSDALYSNSPPKRGPRL